MYRMKNVVFASATLAAASLLFTGRPASACTMSAGAKPQITSPLAADLSALAATAETKNVSHSFVGLWDTKLIADGQVIDEGFDAFHSDGTEILVDQSNPITDNVCLGVWEHTGPLTIKLKHPSWYFDTNGNLLGVVIIHETLTLDPDCDTYHGTSIEDVYDTQGNKIGTYEAKISAKRIRVS
ncbi:MAG TPA: hypothetical protein VMF91_08695 [Bryobacteraceae bacterium]|nr:hypothetical protein [Bryobacteraceae bacterium]